MPLRFKHMPAPTSVQDRKKAQSHKDNDTLLSKGHCKTPSNLVPQWSQTFPEFPGQSFIPLYYWIFFYYIEYFFWKSIYPYYHLYLSNIAFSTLICPGFPLAIKSYVK